MATVIGADPMEAAREETGVPRRDAAEPVDTPIETMAERLVAGETVKIYGFGTFDLRDKRARLGRNPRTGEEVPILARRAVTSRASAKLRERVVTGMATAGSGAQAGRVRRDRDTIMVPSFESAEGRQDRGWHIVRRDDRRGHPDRGPAAQA